MPFYFFLMRNKYKIIVGNIKGPFVILRRKLEDNITICIKQMKYNSAEYVGLPDSIWELMAMKLRVP